MIWKTRRGTLDLTRHGQMMGILNVTPDSFSDGGRHLSLERALAHARLMISEGAAMIDIGGESTRPGAVSVSAAEEIQRTVPVVSALRAEWDGLISIDTSKAVVADAALAAGADIVNDVTGLRGDSAMADVCAANRCGVVVMHMRGEPQTMQTAPRYDDVVAEVREFFEERMEALARTGILPESLCFDPGIGFGKTLHHNLALLRALENISPIDRPLLLGVSRKSFIGALLETNDLTLRDWPTVAITSKAREQGVMLHRVHAVRPNLEAMRMIEAIHHGPPQADTAHE